MRGMLSPSLMCADVLNLQSEIEALDNLGVDYIHLDFLVFLNVLVKDTYGGVEPASV